MSYYLSLDCETTGLNVRKDKVIGFSTSDGIDTAYITHLKWDGTQLVEVIPWKECVTILQTFKNVRLLCHNASFDLQIIKNYFGVDLLDNLYCDSIIASHTLDENKMSYGLKDLTGDKSDQADLKQDMKNKSTKDFYKADHDILVKYAKKDALLTYNLNMQLLKELESGGYNDLFFNELIPLYKHVVIPMQSRGVKINKPLMESMLLNITNDMNRIYDNIYSYIERDLEKFYDYYLEKEYPLKSRGRVFNHMKSGKILRNAQMACMDEDGEGFNILSKHHLGKFFFDLHNETPLSKTEKGNPQVNEEFLESVKDNYVWVEDLITYNKLNKIKSTYIERILNESEDGIFYPSYYMHRTVSGRLSGDFQQMPRPIENDNSLVAKYTNCIREFFIPRDGYIFIDDDYNSLEPRIFAAVAGDEALIDIFKKNHDFYSTIAIMVEGIDASADKNAPNYLGKINKSARQKAKAYSLGIAYGLDDYKLHKDLSISQDEAKRLINGYFTAFPKLKLWMESTKENILTNGFINTRFNRTRRNYEIPQIYKKHGPAILNALDLWKKYNETKGIYEKARVDYKKVRHALNNAYNFQIQGLAAHVINRASIEIALLFKSNNIDAYIIGSIHDELIIECNEKCKDEVSEITQKFMEQTTLLEVPLEAEPSMGYNLREAKG